MFRAIGLVIIMFFSLAVYGKETLMEYVEVVSDVKDSSVEEGWCKVVGYVLDESNGDGIIGAFVSEVGNQHYAYSDTDGKFSFLVKETDSVVYAFHQFYGEIIGSPYDFKSGHVVTLTFNMVEDYGSSGIIHEVEKPVIYMYSNELIEVEVGLELLGPLTFTYPNYDNGWEFVLDSNGINAGGVDYPYLFWEGSLELDFLPENRGGISGFFINTDSTISFLEDKLTLLGLNRVEQVDFITYWAPKMVKHEFGTVQFLVDKVYANNVAGIEVEPTPDNMRRVYMLFEGSDIPVSRRQLVSQELSGFERDGFVVLEWGGSELGVSKSHQLNF